MIPSLVELLTICYEELEPKASKLPIPKGETMVVTAGSHLAHDIEQDIFDMIKKSYDKIGGHSKIQQPSDIGKEYPSWIVADTDEDPEPDVARINSYSPETGGLKGGASATDGTPEAKNKLMQILKQFHSTPGNWSEVSGAMANILIKKLGFQPITDKEKVQRLLGKNRPIDWTGENTQGDSMGANGWYVRKIGSHKHSKIIVGNV